MVAEVLDHGCFHHKLDQVKRNKPNDVLPKAYQNKLHKQTEDLPMPKQCQSKLQRSSGYTVGEAPIGKTGDDSNYKLCQEGGTY